MDRRRSREQRNKARKRFVAKGKKKYDSFAMRAKKAKAMREKRKALGQYRKKFGFVRGMHLGKEGHEEEDGDDIDVARANDDKDSRRSMCTGGSDDKATGTEKRERTSDNAGGKSKRKGKKRSHWYDSILKKQENSRKNKIEAAKAHKDDIKRQRKDRKRAHVRLSKRTTRGQPFMKTQIEHILKKIRKTKASEEGDAV